jgi:DNA-binding Lrp family transcriptional regulator
MHGSADSSEYVLDTLDRQLLNRLQDGFPICERPYLAVANEFSISEDELIARIQNLLAANYLTRFGPMYHAERMGGGLSLAAMSIPPEQFEQVNHIVNSLPEIAHNYERDHTLNMWFVIATEEKEDVDAVVRKIQALTGHPVYNMPKIEEYYVGLRFAV